MKTFTQFAKCRFVSLCDLDDTNEVVVDERPHEQPLELDTKHAVVSYFTL